MLRIVLFSIMLFFTREAWAFPTIIDFKPKSGGFIYTLTASNGVVEDSSRAYDRAGLGWIIDLDITEDGSFDDELFIKGSVMHMPNGIEFNFDFELRDDVTYPSGTTVLLQSGGGPHRVQGRNGYDEMSAMLSYTVRNSGDADFIRYALTIEGVHFDVGAPGSLALFSIGLAALAASRRIRT